MIVSADEWAPAAYPPPDARRRIEHGGMMIPRLPARKKQLTLIAAPAARIHLFPWRFVPRELHRRRVDIRLPETEPSDLIVVDRDLRNVDPGDLHITVHTVAMIDGTIVFER